MRTRSLLLLAFATACARDITGPTPVVTTTVNLRNPTVAPAVVCNAQGDPVAGWPVDVLGSGFSPMPTGVLTGTRGVVMPTVTLAGPETYELPRDRVFFGDSGHLKVNMPTSATQAARQLMPGAYTVRVTNPNRKSGDLAMGLTIVPPPVLTSVTSPIDNRMDNDITITGEGFYPVAGAEGPLPTVVITTPGFPPVTLPNVRVPGATSLVATVPEGTPQGLYDVTVTAPDGCATTLPQSLEIIGLSLGTLTLEPRFGWQLRNQAITIFNSPTPPEVAFSGGAPRVWIIAPLKANPAAMVEIPLRRVAFVDERTITALVPDCSGNAALPFEDAACPGGIQPGGPYALRVRDPIGAEGTIPAERGFYVLTDPPPVITAIAPSNIDTGGLPSSIAPELVVTGESFGAGAGLEILSLPSAGVVRACRLPVTMQGATEIRATVPTSIAAADCVDQDDLGNRTMSPAGFSIAPGLFPLRVQNAQNPAYADYSGLVITQPSLNPVPGPVTETRLVAARADFPLVTATDDIGVNYLYALGGSDGASPLASVEVAPLTLFGDLGGDCTSMPCRFRTLERTALTSARQGAAAVVHTVPGDTSYVYVIGGLAAGGAALATVERAQVLKNRDAPSITDLGAVTGSLDAGSWYYRVSALLAAAHPINPGGETLASDAETLILEDGMGGASLTWTCVPDAVRYRVYRTGAVNAVSGTEQLLEEVDATAGCMTQSYTDDGGRTPSGARPLPTGALSRWVAQPSLATARGQAAARIAGGAIYVVGGTGGMGDVAEVERAMLAGADLGAFSAVGTLNRPRRRHSLAVADATTAPNSFAAADATDAWLVVAGGDQGGMPFGTEVIEVAQVVEGGMPVAPSFTVANYNTAGTHGGWVEIIANTLFQAGSTGGAGFTFRSDFICPGAGNRVGECTGVMSFQGTLNSTALSYRTGGPRFTAGEVLFRAFIYVAGGQPMDTGGAPTDTVERIIY